MIIVKVSGGLGNQMFQYALYRKLIYIGKDAYLDLSGYKEKSAKREFKLNIFNVNYKTASVSNSRKLGECTYTLVDKLRRKIKGEKKSYYSEDLDKGFQPEIFNRDNIYLDGYWQCEKYFMDIRNIILKEFCFPEQISQYSQKMLSEIKQKQAVSIHVRRGDYLESSNKQIYGNICTKEYYVNSICWFKKNLSNPCFFIFSDDIEWSRENLWEPGMKIIEHNKDKEDYEDIFLMSKCAHHIIANSSFSWWGAWLGTNEDKIVIAPEKWFQNHKISDAICEGWICMKST